MHYLCNFFPKLPQKVSDKLFTTQQSEKKFKTKKASTISNCIVADNLKLVQHSNYLNQECIERHDREKERKSEIDK